VSVIRVHWPTPPQRPGGGTVYLDPHADPEPPVAAADLPAPVGRPRTGGATTPEDPMSAESALDRPEPSAEATPPNPAPEAHEAASVDAGASHGPAEGERAEVGGR
jgi:hypothetical protein